MNELLIYNAQLHGRKQVRSKKHNRKVIGSKYPYIYLTTDHTST